MHDLIIIGAGPAGYTASIYASRYKLSNVVIGAVTGGLVMKAHMIENWPGMQSVTGAELMKNFQDHVKTLGADIIAENVVNILKDKEGFKVLTDSNNTYESKAIILALGTEHRTLDIEGEEEFLGKGVSYCTVCDGMFFKDKTVSVIGGSDAAITGALHLSDIASKVYLIYRKEQLRGEVIWHERIKQKENIEVVLNTNVTKIKGEMKVTNISLDNPYNGKDELDVDGVFIEIGSTPTTTLARNLGVDIDDQGYIKIDGKQETTVEGVFAAGDITVGLNKLRQIITASAEGAVAATSVFKYIKKK